jgi:hypothetical protein
LVDVFEMVAWAEVGGLRRGVVGQLVEVFCVDDDGAGGAAQALVLLEGIMLGGDLTYSSHRSYDRHFGPGL